jgi:nucleoid-associated protein YgaU
MGAVLAGVLSVAPLSAQEDKAQSSYVNDLTNNKYLVENKRLVALAEKSLTDAKFDDAVKNAAEAEKFADQSDKYVDAYKAFDAAQARMEWAKKAGVAKRYAEIYTEAETAFTEAAGFRSGEKWDETKTASLRVMTILAQLPEEVPLPAQYLVKAWGQVKDCLWNIAARPEVYNDPAQWQRLYTANRSKFPEPNNPNLIEPGMLLDIPSINDEYRFGVLEGE